MNLTVTSDRPPVRPRDTDLVRRWAAPAAMVAAAVAGAWWAGVSLPAALAAALGLLATLIAVAVLTAPRRGMPRRGAWRHERTPVRRHWHVTDEEIRVGEAGTTIGWRWPAVSTVHVTSAAYLFRQGDGRILDLPRADLGATDDAELRTFLVGRGLLRAGRP